MPNTQQVPSATPVSFSLRDDLSAGLVVFLVALPLCLGIALASGAPLFSGIIAGIVGGTVVAMLSGSQVSVAGPAAGLAVIVATAIQHLGRYEVFLAAVVLAGVFQMILGLLRLGVIGDYVPNSVIKGMLAAIGIVIFLKQIPHALGRDKDFEGDFGFLGASGDNTLTDILSAIWSATPAALLIAIVCLAILLVWERPQLRKFGFVRAIPGPLLVVIAGVAMNELFRVLFAGFQLSGPEHLVNLPVAGSLSDFFQQFKTPDFTAFGNKDVYVTGLTIAVVGSIETLLSVEAADKLDPYKRITNTNRELLAQGAGNAFAGLIGGLPITSVVVRTSANIYAGGRTRKASLTHGVLMLIAALLFPGILNRTPLACLAAILLVIGYKLARPEVFRQIYRSGMDQFLPFIVTVTAIVFTDLLKGVLIGLAVGLFFVIRANHHLPITLVHREGHYLLRFNKDASFVNKSALKNALRSVPKNTTLWIDASKALYIDKDIFEVVEEFRQQAHLRNITLELKNFDRHAEAMSQLAPVSAH
ncbi:MAG: SulP family inorganic anion transporter [Bryobacteraceae bacterium]